MKNDVQIQQEVNAELDREQNIVAGTIGVEVHHGVVKLAGRVRDYAIIQRVEFAARHVEGVATVVIDIDFISTPTVRRSGPDRPRLHSQGGEIKLVPDTMNRD